MAVLVVEDDPDLLDVACFVLRRAGHDTIMAHDGAEALSLWRMKKPDLVLLDIDLPKVDGWEVCRQIRKESATPVIMLTAADRDEDVVRALESGADDYMTKPFSPRQLIARVGAVLRRSTSAAAQPHMGGQAITAGDLTLDPQWRSVKRGGQPLHLTPMELKLLHVLVLHEGQVLTYQMLTDRVWGYQAVDDSSLLKGHIHNLRRKLEEDPANPVCILTVAGIGYTFRRLGDATSDRVAPTQGEGLIVDVNRD